WAISIEIAYSDSSCWRNVGPSLSAIGSSAMEPKCRLSATGPANRIRRRRLAGTLSDEPEEPASPPRGAAEMPGPRYFSDGLRVPEWTVRSNSAHHPIQAKKASGSKTTATNINSATPDMADTVAAP